MTLETLLLEHFQRAMEQKRYLAEVCTGSLERAAELLTRSLVNDARVLVGGDIRCDFVADAFYQQLIYGYQIERPGLPCLRLDSERGPADQQTQLRALSVPGDILLLFSAAGSQPDPLLPLLQQAVDKGLGIILVCHQSQEDLRQMIGPDNIQICFAEGSRALLLENYLTVALTLAALIDHQLFGSEI